MKFIKKNDANNLHKYLTVKGPIYYTASKKYS